MAAQNEVCALESERTTKRRGIFDAWDRVDAQRDQLIQAIESRVTQDVRVEPFFTLR